MKYSTIYTLRKAQSVNEVGQEMPPRKHFPKEKKLKLSIKA